MRMMFLSVAIVASVACNSRKNVQCEQDSNCDLNGGGRCLSADTGNQWCAYPDSSCSSGYRYSDEDVGDGIGGQCSAAPGAVFTLSVVVGGSAAGSVTSTPAGISCSGGKCTGQFPSGTRVSLSQASASGAFLGWSNDCMGGGACSITMDADRTVGALFGTPGQALWVQQLGGSQDDLAYAIAADSAGNLIVVGSFQGAMNAGGTNLTSAGGSDVFVAKLASTTGAVAWAKRFGGSSDDLGLAVAVDSADGIYVTGTFQASADFGDGSVTSAGDVDGFVLKLDGDGGHLWSKTIGGPSGDSATSVAVRGSSVVVVGFYQGTMTLNGMSTTSAGAEDAFIVQYGTSGTVDWTKLLGGPGNDSPTSVAIDSTGNIVVGGRFSGTSNFGGTTGIASTGFDDGFVAKYSGSNGALLFAKPLGGTSFDSVGSVAVDGSDNILAVGMFSGLADFGGPSKLNGNNNNMFVAKYSLAGAYQWAKSFGDSATITGWASSVNTTGDIAVVGGFCGTVSFGGPQLSSVNSCAASDSDIFAVRLASADGSHISSIRAGGTALDVGRGVTETPDGRYYVAGAFQGFAEFGGQGLTSAGGYDAIVLALAPL